MLVDGVAELWIRNPCRGSSKYEKLVPCHLHQTGKRTLGEAACVQAILGRDGALGLRRANGFEQI